MCLLINPSNPTEFYYPSDPSKQNKADQPDSSNDYSLMTVLYAVVKLPPPFRLQVISSSLLPILNVFIIYFCG
jgi:hypothetical protein